MPDDDDEAATGERLEVERRMVALELAVAFVNGDKSADVFAAAEVITIANDFDAYLRRGVTA